MKSGRYANAVAVGLTIGGTIGVLLALPLVKMLGNHLAVMRWVVTGVITYAAVAMLRSALWEMRTWSRVDNSRRGVSVMAPPASGYGR